MMKVKANGEKALNGPGKVAPGRGEDCDSSPGRKDVEPDALPSADCPCVVLTGTLVEDAKTDPKTPPDKTEEQVKEEFQYTIKDTVTGIVYDMSQPDETRLLKAIEELNTLKDSGSARPWQQWWAIKKETDAQLFRASENGDADIVADLLDPSKHGELIADVNMKELDDFTALHYAASEGRTEVVKVLLDHGATVNSLSTSMRTPLHIACYRGNLAIIKLLVGKGANINAQESEGNTPAHILSECGWQDALYWLLNQIPDLAIKNGCRLTAIDVAANVEVHRMFCNTGSVVVEEVDPGYSRTVVDNIILHNNRADMIKSLMFKGQILANQYLSEEEQKKRQLEEKGKPQNPPKQNKKRRIKIIEATRNMSRPAHYAGRIKATMNEQDGLAVGPDYFQPIQMLGKGSFGEVYLVKYKPTGKLYAMKVLSKTRFMSQNLLKYAMAERNVLCYTKHPFIVGLDFAFQTSEKLFLILEYCPGGDIGKIIQKEKRITEDRARIYASEILLGIEDLHRRDIIFRDLKPENVVLDSEGHAMLTDFGLSKEGVTDNSAAKSFCGSVAYLAPEILQRSGHGKSLDWYLLGLMIYEMLVGIPPYYSPDKQKLYRNIQTATLRFPLALSPEVKDLVSRLIDRVPSKRLGAGSGDSDEIKRHPWFKSIDWGLALARGLKPPRPPPKLVPVTHVSPDVFLDSEKGAEKVPNWSIANKDAL